MSRYSTDSLEDASEDFPRSHNVLENVVKLNLQPIKAINHSSYAAPFYLKHTGSNETTSNIGTSKDTGTAGSRNAIIANGDASRQRHPTSSRNRRKDVTDRLERNNTVTPKGEEEGNKKRVPSRCSKRSSKAFLSPKRNCCPKESSMPTKPDKKLGNVLEPRIQQARKSCSYLELYRRRFSGPRYNSRSPEGSTLSVWGDSHREQLTDGDTRSSATSRDDQSEPSFYRCLIEGSVDPLATSNETSETVHRPEDTNIQSTSTNGGAKHSFSDKSKKSTGYRPYTIEEYKTLSVPKLDRSLGPDKVEMQAKSEWLMRRRSYGNSVSALNRQRILLQTQKLKLKEDIAEKCFLPPLKDQEVDAKTRGDAIFLTTSEAQETTSKNGCSNCSRYSKRSHELGKPSSPRRSKKFERTPSFCSSLNSRDFIEDSYFESLRQRQLNQKEMVDRIINRALCT